MGSAIEVMVLEVEGERIRLSRKAVFDADEKAEVRDYTASRREAGEQGLGHLQTHISCTDHHRAAWLVFFEISMNGEAVMEVAQREDAREVHTGHRGHHGPGAEGQHERATKRIKAYNALRGYTASADPCANPPAGHDPAMWRKHNDCD